MASANAPSTENRAGGNSNDNREADRSSFDIPDIEKVAQRLQTSLKTLLLLAWVLTLSRYAGEEDVTQLGWKTEKDPNGSEDDSVHVETVHPSNAISAIIEQLDAALKPRSQASTKSGTGKSEATLVVSNGDFSTSTLRMEMVLEDGQLCLTPHFSGDMTQFLAHVYLQATAENVVKTLSDANRDDSASKLCQLGGYDRAQIWRWNKEVPPNIPNCIQDVITKQAQATPEAQAVDSWDGKLTYEEVEKYSDSLAHRLVSLGLEVDQLIPLCFEKSRWTVVAVLAVLKAGGGLVLMDPSQPLQRLQGVAEQVDAKFMITSKKQAAFGSQIAPQAQLVEVDETSFKNAEKTPETQLPKVSPSSTLYIIFTSGSTGKPKGVVISHETFTSGAIPRAEEVGYNTKTRNLDFASYAFDVSIDNMFVTLLSGGCLCIPSDDERVNDLSGAIRRFKINMANLTPSVARVLDDDVYDQLTSLGLGGEAVNAKEVNEWGKHTRIMIAYGPSETTVGCTINYSAASGKAYTNLGRGIGGNMWVVNSDDDQRLVPIGAVGELLVEGPIVGQGYLNDPEKTAAAFIKDPAWLVAGDDAAPGRRGRLYKTGDLVRHDPDGSGCLVFVGRKDTQVKLRGQRIELGEIEHQMRAHLPQGTQVAAEVFVPHGQSTQPTLVGFISQGPTEGSSNSKIELAKSPQLRRWVSDLESSLPKVLPKYMVPPSYVPVNQIPMLVSGKTDRKQLREFGTSQKLQDLAIGTETKAEVQEPTTETEIKLQQMWSKLMGIEKEEIGREQSFFALGGDSVLAMKLVTAARESNMLLTIANIFKAPSLKDVAQSAREVSGGAEQEVPPFSLLGRKSKAEAARKEASKALRMSSSAIEDLYSCTPLQETLLAFSARTAGGGFVAQRVADISSLSDVKRFKEAWQKVFQDSMMLRTRVVQIPDHGFVQVVLKEDIDWQTSDNLDSYLATDKDTQMQLGNPLARYAIVDDSRTGRRYFVWTIHHALYDGWSTPIVVDRVRRAYEEHSMSSFTQMKQFVAYLTHPERLASRDYWRSELANISAVQYPIVPYRTYLPKADARADRDISLQRAKGSSITSAIIIRAAWALVASQYTGSDDIIIGETLNGRNVPVSGAEEMDGPMVTTVPIRVRVNREASIKQYLQTIQDDGIRMMQHEHLGLQNIRKLSDDAQLACELKMGLNIQPSQGTAKAADQMSAIEKALDFGNTDAAGEALQFNSYPLLLVCAMRSDGFRAMTGFDSGLVSVPQMNRVLVQFDKACQQLSQAQDSRVADIELLTEEDLNEIWNWNRGSTDTDGHHKERLTKVNENRSADDEEAMNGIPWIVDAGDSERLVPIGAVGELLLEQSDSSIEDFIDSPKWLKAGHGQTPGRQARLYKSGYLAKYDEQGSVMFVGRTATKVTLRGRAIDLDIVEHHLRRLLPDPTGIAVSVVSAEKTDEEMLIAFVKESQARSDDTSDPVELYMNGYTEPAKTSLPTGVMASFSPELAKSLLEIDNYMADALPQFMIPSAYIPVEEVKLDRPSVQGLSSKLSTHEVCVFKDALLKLRKDSASNTKLTEKEQVLQKLWAPILGVEDASTIGPQDSFFGLGGDSIMAMKLVSAARNKSYSLSVTDIFRNMRLNAMAEVMEESTQSDKQKTEYTPYSMLECDNVDDFLNDRIRPAMADVKWKITDVLPVTDPQARDIDATIGTHRSAVHYTMLFFNEQIRHEGLYDCCKRLIRRHEILRTVFVKHESHYLQVVLEEGPPLDSKTITEDEDFETVVRKLCEEDIETPLKLGSHFAMFTIFRNKHDKCCLVMRLSHAQYDGIAHAELIRQLSALYEDKQISQTPQFSAYLHAAKEQESETIDHWREKLKGSNLTVLDNEAVKESSSSSVFPKKHIDISKRPEDVTMASLLTAAWAVVLSRHSKSSDIVFGTVSSGRTIDLADAESIVGPCYNYLPVRLQLRGGMSYTDLLNLVQDEALSNAQYDSLGFGKIKEHCTDWTSDLDFFDSTINSQDLDYSDTTTFAGTECRIDTIEPHGMPSYPWRIVSYVENGKTYLGMLGPSSREAFIKETLDELAAVVGQLIESPETKL